MGLENRILEIPFDSRACPPRVGRTEEIGDRFTICFIEFWYRRGIADHRQRRADARRVTSEIMPANGFE